MKMKQSAVKKNLPCGPDEHLEFIDIGEMCAGESCVIYDRVHSDTSRSLLRV